MITNIPGHINDEVNKYKLGFTSIPGNPFALAKAIKKLLETSMSEREAMGRNARLLAEKTYSREIINKKYAKLLFDLDKNNI